MPSLNIDVYKMKCKDYYWLTSMVLPVLQQDPKMGKKNWNQGTLIGRQNLVTLEKYVMKTDNKNSNLSYSID